MRSISYLAGSPVVYKHFDQASAALADLQTIDYYMAQSMVENFKATDDVLFWHCIAALSKSLRDGHSCLDLKVLAGQTLWQQNYQDLIWPGYEFPSLDTCLGAMQHQDLQTQSGNPLVLEDTRLYIRRYWQFEEDLALNVRKRIDTTQAIDTVLAQRHLDNLFGSKDADNWQKIAVANALGRRFAMIVGGPGTGKTYTVTRLIALFLILHHEQTETKDEPTTGLLVRLAAPTGKAAQRLSESIRAAKAELVEKQLLTETLLKQIPDEATTLHRLLGSIPHQPHFRHDENFPLNVDLLVLDEVSMVDLPLMSRLFRALSDNTQIVLLGDADQLPSVAAGSVLHDLVPRPHTGYSTHCAQKLLALTRTQVPVAEEGSMDYVTLLEKSHRFKSEGAIGRLANAVIQGDENTAWNILESEHEQLDILTCSGELDDWLQDHAIGLYSQLLQADGVESGFEQLNRLRILTPYRAGRQGIAHINQTIELCLQRQGLIPRAAAGMRQANYRGRPIMVTQNHYGLKLFNGDTGLIWRHQGKLMAAFPGADGHIRWISPARLPPVETIYAMTIHKTQGSEYERVLLVIPEDDSPLLTRELLYTGITRAKINISLIADKRSFKRMVRRHVTRYSGLAEKVLQN